MPLAASNQV
jgi:hypothetical protein